MGNGQVIETKAVAVNGKQVEFIFYQAGLCVCAIEYEYVRQVVKTFIEEDPAVSEWSMFPNGIDRIVINGDILARIKESV